MNKKEKQNFLILASHEASEKEKQEKNTEYNSGTALLLGGGGRATSRDVIAKPNLKIRARSGVEALFIFLGLRTNTGGF